MVARRPRRRGRRLGVTGQLGEALRCAVSELFVAVRCSCVGILSICCASDEDAPGAGAHDVIPTAAGERAATARNRLVRPQSRAPEGLELRARRRELARDDYVELAVAVGGRAESRQFVRRHHVQRAPCAALIDRITGHDSAREQRDQLVRTRGAG